MPLEKPPIRLSCLLVLIVCLDERVECVMSVMAVITVIAMRHVRSDSDGSSGALRGRACMLVGIK